MVKKAAKNLFAKEPSNYTADFDHNKRVLGNSMPSKPIRNKIAGYIARLVRMQKAGPRPMKKPELAETKSKFQRREFSY